MGKVKQYFRNRNLATPTIQHEAKQAVKDVLAQYELEISDDLESQIDHYIYEIVADEYGGIK